jgi:hypothetical protein
VSTVPDPCHPLVPHDVRGERILDVDVKPEEILLRVRVEVIMERGVRRHFASDLGARVVQSEANEVVAQSREFLEQDALLDLVLVGVLAVGANGVWVQPAGADLKQLPHQLAHLGPFAEEGPIGVGRRRNAGVVDLRA